MFKDVGFKTLGRQNQSSVPIVGKMFERASNYFAKKEIVCLVVILLAMTTLHQVNAEPQKTVCVYEPMDLFMDKGLTGLIYQQTQNHNATVKTVRIIDQILQKGDGCDIIIKIDRAINENYWYTDRTIKYLISNNTITIFTYKTADVFNPVSGEPLKPMTNWSCEITAHVSKYQNNYHITDSGYYNTYTGYCNPYKGTIDPSRAGELPYNVIRSSVDSALAKFEL